MTYCLKNYSGSKDKFEKETLSGKRTVIAEEPTEGREWSKEEVKSLVGGTSQKVRAPYGQFKTVEIQAKIFLSSNTKPNLSQNEGEGLLRSRMRSHALPTLQFDDPERYGY